MKIDFAKFKKVHEDHTHAVLQHPEGHQIRIAKDKLSKGLKTQLASLPQHFADGGEVNQSPPTEEWDPSTLKSFTEPPKPGEPWKVGDGGYRPDPALMSQHSQSIDSSIPYGASDSAGADRSPAGIVDDVVQGGQNIANWLHDKLVPGAEARGNQIADQLRTQYGPAPQDDPQQAAGQAQPTNYAVQGPSPAQVAKPQTAPMASAYDQYGNALNRGINEQKQGFQAEYQANKQDSQYQQEAAQSNIASIEGFQKQAQDNWNAYNQERQHLLDDIQNNHINPNHYFESKSTPAKISTAIGLILGGIGGALTHQENPALKFLNAQIDRDIESQKMELGKKETLLSANFKHFGNMQDALNMTRVMQNDIYSSQLKNAAAKTQDQMAKARLLQQAGTLDMQSAPLLQQVTMNKTMMQALSQSQSNPDQFLSTLRVVAPDKAKEIEGRYIPGIGIGSVPIPDKTREEVIARDDLQKQIRNLRVWSQQHSGSLSPEQKNYGQALASQVQDAYRRANGQGVFREGEAEFVKGIVEADPTKFFNSWRVDPKYRALEDSNGATLNHLKRSYGLPESNYAAQPLVNVPKGYKKKG